MHDAIIGERLGLPSVGILTETFVSAGELMARVLGAEGYRFVVTDHPIASASSDALQDRAERAMVQGASILLGD